MLSEAMLWLSSNEPVISAMVGIVTLSAGAWGLLRLRYLEPGVMPGQPATVGPLQDPDRSRPRKGSALQLRKAPRKLLNLGISNKSKIEEIVASRTINVAVVALLILSLVWIITGLLVDGFIYFTILNCIVFLVGLLILMIQAAGGSATARWLLLVLVFSYWSIVQLSIGRLWGIEYYLVILCVLPILLFKRYETLQRVSAICLLLVVFALQMLFSTIYPGGLLQVDEPYLRLGYLLNVPLLCLIVYGIVNYYASFSIDSFHSLENQKSKGDELVKSIFPEDVIEQVRENVKTIAAYRDEAAVLFISLKGFEDLYRRVTAKQLVELLSGIFLEFDELLEKHSIEKINVLGTHYVAASGVFANGAPDHAAVARFALDATAAVVRFSEESNHNFSLRAGISVGQVVSGIIGDARPCFDIWGETVELAISMQDAAVSNTVVVSERAYWRLKDQFELAELTSCDGGYILLREVKSVAPATGESP